MDCLELHRAARTRENSRGTRCTATHYMTADHLLLLVLMALTLSKLLASFLFSLCSCLRATTAFSSSCTPAAAGATAPISWHSTRWRSCDGLCAHAAGPSWHAEHLCI